MDRSMQRISSSRSPLKSRPVFREMADERYRFHTPKAGGNSRSKYYSQPRTPQSSKGCYSVANRSLTGGARGSSVYSTKRNFSRYKIGYNQRRSRPNSSMGTYSISRMMKHGTTKNSTHHTSNRGTYRQFRCKEISSKTYNNTKSNNRSGTAGRTYNLYKRQASDKENLRHHESSTKGLRRNGLGAKGVFSNEYEPISKTFVERGGAMHLGLAVADTKIDYSNRRRSREQQMYNDRHAARKNIISQKFKPERLS